MRQTIDEQKEENPNQNGRNGTNVAQRKYKACLNSQNRDISKRIVVPGVKKNRSDEGVGLLFTMESSVCTHDILVITPFLLFTLLCASTREWKLHGASSFARKHGFVPLPEWLYDERKHDCRIEGMLMADFPKKTKGARQLPKYPRLQPIAPKLITAETILRPNYVTISLITYLFKTLLTFHMR